MTEQWIPGAETAYHPEGSVIQHSAGTYYVREAGRWRLMTPAETTQYLTNNPGA
jgi:hypothetical protein